MSIVSQVRALEVKVTKLEAENKALKERLRSGYRETRPNATREKIRKYQSANPTATIRAIQKACDCSSPSVVSHHLKILKFLKLEQKERDGNLTQPQPEEMK